MGVCNSHIFCMHLHFLFMDTYLVAQKKHQQGNEYVHHLLYNYFLSSVYQKLLRYLNNKHICWYALHFVLHENICFLVK